MEKKRLFGRANGGRVRQAWANGQMIDYVGESIDGKASRSANTKSLDGKKKV